MVVFGDAEWISDLSLTKGTETPPDVYYSLFASAIDWLSERPGLGIRPREPGIYVMKTDVAKESSRLVLLPGWILVLGTLGVGLGVWVVRRR